MEACAILFLGALLAATPFAHASCYTPPGVLGALVDEKRREVDRMRNLPEAREDGPWFMRLHYPANAGSYVLGRTLGWKRERPTVLVDLKRASPTGQLGITAPIAPDMVISAALVDAVKLGVDGALVCTDLASYGGSMRDLKDACTMARDGSLRSVGNAAAASDGEPTIPVIAKDLIVDPLQIARAACEGARAVLLIAAAILPDLPLLLDTCTVLGLEAIVEVHTPDEMTVASGGASILLVNESRSRIGQTDRRPGCGARIAGTSRRHRVGVRGHLPPRPVRTCGELATMAL